MPTLTHQLFGLVCLLISNEVGLGLLQKLGSSCRMETQQIITPALWPTWPWTPLAFLSTRVLCPPLYESASGLSGHACRKEQACMVDMSIPAHVHYQRLNIANNNAAQVMHILLCIQKTWTLQCMQALLWHTGIPSSCSKGTHT